MRSTRDLQEQCGDFIGQLAVESTSAEKLGRVLKARSPSTHTTDGVIAQWFRQSLDFVPVNLPRHLELKCGERVRDGSQEALACDAKVLRVWASSNVERECVERTCQTCVTAIAVRLVNA